MDHWNSLPDKVVEASSVNSSKSSINKHWRDYPLKCVPDFYGPEAGISVYVIMTFIYVSLYFVYILFDTT
jgi:hypothetical protein